MSLLILLAGGSGEIAAAADIAEAADGIASGAALALAIAAAPAEAGDTLSSEAAVALAAGAQPDEAADGIVATTELALAAGAAITEGDSAVANSALVLTGCGDLAEGNDEVAFAAQFAQSEGGEDAPAPAPAPQQAASGGTRQRRRTRLPRFSPDLRPAPRQQISAVSSITEDGDSVRAAARLNAFAQASVAEHDDVAISLFDVRGRSRAARRREEQDLVYLEAA